jgi:hypothetical protein
MNDELLIIVIGLLAVRVVQSSPGTLRLLREAWIKFKRLARKVIRWRIWRREARNK